MKFKPGDRVKYVVPAGFFSSQNSEEFGTVIGLDDKPFGTLACVYLIKWDGYNDAMAQFETVLELVKPIITPVKIRRKPKWM